MSGTATIWQLSKAIAPFPSGLSVWARYKASTLGLTDGSFVASWGDISGNGRAATAVLGAQPIMRTSAAGLVGNTNAVEFSNRDSTPINMAIPDMSALTQGEMFVFLIKDDDDGATPRRLHQIGSATDFYYVYLDHKIYDGFGSTVRKTAGAPSGGVTTWHNYDVYSNTNDWQCFKNNVSIFSTVTNTVGFPVAPIFGGYPGGTVTTRAMAGKIAEMVILDTVTDSAHRAAMNAYFRGEYLGL